MTLPTLARSIIFIIIVLIFAKRASSEPDYTCDFANDQCGSQFDDVCDSLHGNNSLPGCGTSDCWDCNVFCTTLNGDCKGCLGAKGCYFCPGDGTCNNSPLYTFNGLIQSCTEPVDYLFGGNLCTHTPEENFFEDPLYDGQRWVYDMINIVPVWEKGYFGRGVRVRVNDDGVKASHLGTCIWKT